MASVEKNRGAPCLSPRADHIHQFHHRQRRSKQTVGVFQVCVIGDHVVHPRRVLLPGRAVAAQVDHDQIILRRAARQPVQLFFDFSSRGLLVCDEVNMTGGKPTGRRILEQCGEVAGILTRVLQAWNVRVLKFVYADHQRPLVVNRARDFFSRNCRRRQRKRIHTFIHGVRPEEPSLLQGVFGLRLMIESLLE